jgi:hypothetical protein
MAQQADRLAESQKALKAAEAKAAEATAAASKPRVGTEAVGTRNVADAREDSDPIAAWEQIIAENVARGMTRPKAISKATKEHPEEHRAYLEAYNAQFRWPGPAR